MTYQSTDKLILIEAGRITYRKVESLKYYKPKYLSKYRVRCDNKLIDSFLSLKNLKKIYPGIKAH